MSDIQVQCSACGASFEVSDELAGLIAPCPACKQEMRVPLPAGGAAGVSRLQVKRDHVLAGGKKCPACDATMAEDAVICIHCGFDTRTGLRLETDNPRARLFQMVAKVLLVAVIAGAAWMAYKRLVPSESAPAAAAAPQVVATAAEPAPAAAPASPVAAAPTTAIAGLVVTQSLVVTQAQAAASGAATNLTPQDLVLMEQKYRESVVRQMDQFYPPYAVGATVVLRRVTGLVHRGMIQEFRKESVVLLADGAGVEVPLVSLDQTSRLRCDAAFRTQFIAFQVRKRMQNVDRL